MNTNEKPCLWYILNIDKRSYSFLWTGLCKSAMESLNMQNGLYKISGEIFFCVGLWIVKDASEISKILVEGGTDFEINHRGNPKEGHGENAKILGRGDEIFSFSFSHS